MATPLDSRILSGWTSALSPTRTIASSAFRFRSSRALLAEHLPAKVLRCLDLESLRLVDGSFVDEELRRSQSDLLFECELKPEQLAGILESTFPKQGQALMATKGCMMRAKSSARLVPTHCGCLD
ncbi:MAG: Rpn family recombination-promoting nuclease/putative transposase [Candidatus Paceibacterota bacterium]